MPWGVSYKKHNIKSVERQYVSGTQCPICLVEWWSRERIINHLRYRSPTCRLNLLMYPPELTIQQAEELDREAVELYRSLAKSGRRRHAAVQPCVQALGPMRPIVLEPGCESSHHPLGRGHRYKR